MPGIVQQAIHKQCPLVNQCAYVLPFAKTRIKLSAGSGDRIFEHRDGGVLRERLTKARLIEKQQWPFEVGRGRPGHCLERLFNRKSTRLNSSHVAISYAVFCLKKKISAERT